MTERKQKKTEISRKVTFEQLLSEQKNNLQLLRLRNKMGNLSQTHYLKLTRKVVARLLTKKQSLGRKIEKEKNA